MNEESGPSPLCALRLGDDVLSAWHDTALRGAQARQVEAHVTGCVPCQVRLSVYESLGALLRAQLIPEPRPNALIELNARIVARHPRRRVYAVRPYASALPHPGSWRGLLVLIAALLLAALVARFITAGLQHAGGQPTPHAVPHTAAALIAQEIPWPAKTS